MNILTSQFIGIILSLVLPYIATVVSLSVMTNPVLAQEVVSEECEECIEKADQLFQEGVELRQREQYDVALEKFQAALSAYEALGDRKRQADTLNQLGNIYLSLNQHERASEFYQQALALRQEHEQASATSVSSDPIPSQPSERIVFQSADISLPGMRASPGTRGALLVESPIALMPETNYGQTTKPYPTLFIYLPETGQSNQNLEVSFHLVDEQDELRYTATRTYPETGGILGIHFEELENMAPLEVEQKYQWYVEISENSDPTILHLSGWIQRVETTSPAVNSTEVSLEDELYHATQTGLWYDALAALFELRQRNPDNSQITVNLRELLTSVGLDDIDISNFTGYWSDKPIAAEQDETNTGTYFRPPADVVLPTGRRTSGGSR